MTRRSQSPRHSVRPGADATILAVWTTWIALCAATWATNARTPLRLLYAVDAAGIGAGAGRVVVLLGWPIALLAIALAAFAADRLLTTEPAPRIRRAVIGVASLSIALCATVFGPDVFDPKHLDAKPVNAPAAVGVALAFALSVWSLVVTRFALGRPRVRSRYSRPAALALLALLFAALPWLLANLGFYVGDVPGLRTVFMSKQVVPEPGYPHLRAVHLGNHDGLDGLVLAVAAAALMWSSLGSMRRLRSPMRAYLSLLVVYGLAVAVGDWWVEQVVKRGWVSERIPSVMYPSVSPAWAGIVIAAAVIFSVGLHRSRRARHGA